MKALYKPTICDVQEHFTLRTTPEIASTYVQFAVKWQKKLLEYLLGDCTEHSKYFLYVGCIPKYQCYYCRQELKQEFGL